MTSPLVADSIVSLCGAMGLAIAIAILRRRDPRGALTRRFTLALGVVASLFLFRGAAAWTGSDLLENLGLALAAVLPLAVLIVTEGVLRRHAPRPLKLLVTIISGAAIVTIISGAAIVTAFLGGYRLWPAAVLALAGFQIATFASCAALLIRRDAASLTAAENLGIGRIAMGALIVIPFLLSDYHELIAFVPIRLGPLGALLVVSLMLIAGESAQSRLHASLLLGLRVLAATGLGAATATIVPQVTADDVWRFSAIAVSGVLTIGLLADTLRALLAARTPGMLGSIAASSAVGRDALLAELLDHPVFAAARRLGPDALADFDPTILSAALGTRTVLRFSERPWGLVPTDPAAERLTALMATHAATHLMVMASDPLDLLVVTIPVVSADQTTETALLLMRRILAASPA